MEQFSEKLRSFFADFGKARKMVLSTSAKDKVSSRMMSVVQIDGKFYFQTDKKLRKYRQISVNKNIALCIDNIQIEGVCKEIGSPLDNDEFCNAFRVFYKGSYDAYTSLEDERLFVVEPVFIERWIYFDRVPYIETYDIEAEYYSCNEYSGV